MEKFKGTVIWFNPRPKKGYGFLEWEKDGEPQTDMFVHFSDVVSDGFRTLKKGQVVTFLIGENNQGKPKAIEVVVVEE